MVSPQNLPHLLPSDPNTVGTSDYVLEIPALHNLTLEFLERDRNGKVLIVAHPGSHYICTDNVLGVMDEVEQHYDDLAASRHGDPLGCFIVAVWFVGG